MSTRSRIQDGAGTTGRAAVFNNRMRELATEQSLSNHISTSILGGRTGVFTVRVFTSGNLANTLRSLVLSISNNDPINLLVIDRMYLQIMTSSVNLPLPGFILTVDKIVSSSNISNTIRNENIFSRTIPLIFAGALTTGVAAINNNVNIIRIFPTLGDINELIIPGSNGIILPGSITPPVVTAGANTVGMTLYNGSGVSITGITYEAFIKFMMVPPDQLG